MTKMRYGGMSPYDAAADGTKGGAQEYNPVTPLPNIMPDPLPQGGGSPPKAEQGNWLYEGYYGNPNSPEKDYTWKQDSSGTYQRTDGVDTTTGQWLFPDLNQGQDPMAYLASIKSSRGGSATPQTTGGATFGGGSPGIVAGAIGQQAQSWQVDPSQTVEGRTAGIINKDGALMQQARGYANQRSNERGLINSSLGIQAAQDAVLGRATDIAKQDAATYADAGKFNVNQSNSWNLAQQELAQKGNQFDKDLQYRYDSARMNNENAVAMATLENKFQSQLQSDAAFNSQYRAYVDALLIIDQIQGLDEEAKMGLKYDQARILENYASIRGLNLNLDFSGQYKGSGSGVGSGNDRASSTAPAAGGGNIGGAIAGGDMGAPPGVTGDRGGDGSSAGQGSVASGQNASASSDGTGSTDANQGLGLGYVGGLSPAQSSGMMAAAPGLVSSAVTGSPFGLVSAAWNGYRAYTKKDAESQASAAVSNNANMGYSSAADSQAAADAGFGWGGDGFGGGPGGYGGGFSSSGGFSSGGAGGGGYSDGSGPGGDGGFGGFGGAGAGGAGGGAGGAGGYGAGSGGSGD